MVLPQRITKEYLCDERYISWRGVFISGSDPHPNPRLYKYDWWVYDTSSPYDSAAEVFYKPEHRLSTKAFETLTDRLHKENIKYAYVNRKRRRLGVSIWDYDRMLTENPNMTFAPAYEDDTDEPYEGHK